MIEHSENHPLSSFLPREYYMVDEAARRLRCDVKDILHWCSLEEIGTYLNFNDDFSYKCNSHATDENAIGSIELVRADINFEGSTQSRWRLHGLWKITHYGLSKFLKAYSSNTPCSGGIVLFAKNKQTTKGAISDVCPVIELPSDCPLPTPYILHEDLALLENIKNLTQQGLSRLPNDQTDKSVESSDQLAALTAQNAELTERLQQTEKEIASLAQRLQQAETENAMPKTPDYLNPLHLRYSPKLAATITAWLAFEKWEGGGTVKQALKNLLKMSAAQYDLVDKDGKPVELAMEECSKVANWVGGGPGKARKID